MPRAQLRSPSLPQGAAALVLDDRRSRVAPSSDAAWADWVSASRTRNFVLDETLLDWLDLFGPARGIRADQMRDGYDPRTDFSAFILARGEAFEAAVVRRLKREAVVRRIASKPAHVRDLAMAERTVAAMAEGVEVITQGVLRDPVRRTYGAADALVRADTLARLFPGEMDAAGAAAPAPGLGRSWHYVVLDVKYHTLDLRADGSAAADAVPFMVQVWLYSEALGRIQGYRPPAAFLLGRNWTRGGTHGAGAMDRLARVDHDRAIPRGPLGGLADDACAWIRRLRAQGAGWAVRPRPSVPELWPNMKSNEDAPWHAAKRELADELRDLTLLPGVSPAVRRAAHAQGVYRWSDVRARGVLLPLVAERSRAALDGVLRANVG